MDRKPDMIDYLLSLGEKTATDKIISDYPETVGKILKKFISLWKLPEYAIPTKKQKGQYSQWILELQDLENLCAKNINGIMDRAYREYITGKMNFMVTHPSAIRKLVIDTIGKMNREISERKEILPETIVEPAERETLLKVAKDLKSIFKDKE